ncbi:MAG: OadG family protein, partial [Clostridia bacterium]|nr:OadG family protein [Clostridia bacterium]MBQ7075711.1 OadG family protein [Clostridia bacterium]
MIQQAFVISVIGYFLCFAVLAVIWTVLSIMKKLMTEKKPAAVPEVKPAPEVKVVAENNDDDEIIAVLTAAIAASLNTSGSNLRIKSFKRLSSGLSRWGTTSVNENLINKL